MMTFLESVNKEINEVPIQRCFHCRKCTAGCPLAEVMEYNPNRIIKMIQMGQEKEVLESKAIWLCASCETCVTRCPNEVNIARMMDVLREMTLNKQTNIAEKNIVKFHDSFLAAIKIGGRINEPLMMVLYKLKSGDFFSDMVMGVGMFLKGKLSLVSPRTKDIGSVKNIFSRTKSNFLSESKR